jgi:ubiquinone/menaquinone biosynthesis C-methylase UbiE
VGFYGDKILPYCIHTVMRREILAPYRQRVVSAANGCVLEVGIGSGLNLRYYGDGASQVIGIDPSATSLAIAAKAKTRHGFAVELLTASAEAIPLEDHRIDSVVSTWTLCTIPNVARALREMRRVLKPNGRLFFVEHGLSHDTKVRRWQDRLTPIWKHINGGCHLNRAIGQLIEDAGFRIERLETSYMKGPKPMTFMYEGSARLD